MILHKKQNMAVILGLGVIAVVFLVVFVYFPLVNKYQELTYEVDQVHKDLIVAQNFINKREIETSTGRLIDESQIAMAIDDITEAGQKFEIKFVSISPRDIEKLENSPYGRLPIEVSVICDYAKLGEFLGALHNLRDSIVTVKNFDMQRDEEILPLIKSKLILEVYLNNG